MTEWVWGKEKTAMKMNTDKLQSVNLGMHQQTCVSMTKPVNAASHQQMVLVMRLDISALGVVQLTCYMFTVFVPSLNLFYEHH